MAFADPQPDVELSWSDGAHAGLVVSVRYRTLAARVAVERFDARPRAGRRVREKDIARLAEVFVAHVNGWSVRGRDGWPVPVTAAAFLLLDVELTVLPILRQWLELVRSGPQVAAPEQAAEEPVVEPSGVEWFDRLESRRIPDSDLELEQAEADEEADEQAQLAAEEQYAGATG